MINIAKSGCEETPVAARPTPRSWGPVRSNTHTGSSYVCVEPLILISVSCVTSLARRTKMHIKQIPEANGSKDQVHFFCFLKQLLFRSCRTSMPLRFFLLFTIFCLFFSLFLSFQAENQYRDCWRKTEAQRWTNNCFV